MLGSTQVAGPVSPRPWQRRGEPRHSRIHLSSGTGAPSPYETADRGVARAVEGRGMPIPTWWRAM